VSAKKKSFCIVCIANYCRSPVAENLLKKRFGDEYEFLSAGIEPISQPNMDIRSLNFLKEKNVNHNFHIPKKVNRKMLDYFDIFLAVDFFVLNQLNISYPKYKKKFRLLNMQFSDVNLTDPYQFQANEYIKIMNNIKFITENINLEEM